MLATTHYSHRILKSVSTLENPRLTPDSNARPKPISQFVFADLASRNLFHNPDSIERVKFEALIAVSQKHTRCNPSRTLVAIDKTMIPGQAKSISRSQFGGVRVAISGKIHRTR